MSTKKFVTLSHIFFFFIVLIFIVAYCNTPRAFKTCLYKGRGCRESILSGRDFLVPIIKIPEKEFKRVKKRKFIMSMLENLFHKEYFKTVKSFPHLLDYHKLSILTINCKAILFVLYIKFGVDF
jgi:hypothetical protein